MSASRDTVALGKLDPGKGTTKSFGRNLSLCVYVFCYRNLLSQTAVVKVTPLAGGHHICTCDNMSGYIYCVCLCTMCLWVEPRDWVYLWLNAVCVKVWESNAMQWMQRLSNRSSLVCVMSAQQRGIHSYRWVGQSAGRAIHTRTHMKTQTDITLCEVGCCERVSCHVPCVQEFRYFPMKWVSEKTLD